MNQTPHDKELLESTNNLITGGESSETDAGLSILPTLTSCNSFGEVEEHHTPEYVPGTFEGPEKILEVCFRPGVVILNTHTHI